MQALRIEGTARGHPDDVGEVCEARVLHPQACDQKSCRNGIGTLEVDFAKSSESMDFQVIPNPCKGGDDDDGFL